MVDTVGVSIQDSKFYDNIVNLLKELKYKEDEIQDLDWVKSMLIIPNEARTRLLLWILSHVCSPNDVAEVKSIIDSRTQVNKITQLLNNLGLCKVSDSKIIEGTSSESSQLKFWCTCLKSVKGIKSLPTVRNASNNVDSFLDHFAQSTYLKSIMKGTVINPLPGDLIKKYKEWNKQGHVEPLEQQLDKLKLQISNHNNSNEQQNIAPWNKENYDSAHTEMVNSANGLPELMKLFNQVHSSYISPWTLNSTPYEPPKSGPTVYTACNQLDALNKIIEARNIATVRSAELRDNDTSIQESQTSIVTTLHLLNNTS